MSDESQQKSVQWLYEQDQETRKAQKSRQLGRIKAAEERRAAYEAEITAKNAAALEKAREEARRLAEHKQEQERIERDLGKDLAQHVREAGPKNA